MAEIIELIEDFELNQKVQERKKEYVSLCKYRLNRWRNYMAEKFNITEFEEVKPIHIKQYIRYCQQLGKEKAITINGSIATLRVFFYDLVEEEFIDEPNNPIRRIKNLKEVRKVIHTFTDEEVKRILRDVTEYTYSNVRDK
ncbi:tyrosine-type recombinase/integrase [Viridibacillus sp. NPDC093762]|uniref:tyrosine-type recombinase/integrase n=1 Tax=Viridibacillus sp. NPDC093762 TaxID=3390720 RepID=UPI003D032CAF